MPTHKVLCDLDVGGEVKGTSLDINGNADISGNLSGVDTLTATGLDINGNADVSGNLTGFTFTNDYNLANDTNFLDAADGALINFSTNALTLGATTTTVSGILDITGTTDATDATGDTGILRCEGGASIAKKIFAGSTITGSADVIAFSDKKLKDNIKTLDGKKVLDMRGVSFDRIDTGKASSGVIAQEIQEVAPELVHDTDGTLGVAYGNLVGYLIEAIKDQQKQIDELKEMCNGCSK